MLCTDCGCKSKTLETRLNEHNWVFRRRQCTECGRRWSTYEIPTSEVTVDLPAEEEDEE